MSLAPHVLQAAFMYPYAPTQEGGVVGRGCRVCVPLDGIYADNPEPREQITMGDGPRIASPRRSGSAVPQTCRMQVMQSVCATQVGHEKDALDGTYLAVIGS